MIIDFHTHVFPEKIAERTLQALSAASNDMPFSDGTIDGLLSTMKDAEVDLSVCLPVMTKPTQFDSLNRFAIELNERFSGQQKGVISFGGIHPLCENIPEKMRFLKENGLKGVKIHPDYQDTFINDQAYIDIINEAKNHDMIVVTHAGIDNGFPNSTVKCPPELTLDAIKKTGHKKLVLAHYGGHKLSNEVLDVLCGCDVYFDTALVLNEIDKKTFISILDKHGADKILFATDSPWRDVKKDVDIVKNYGLDNETIDKILYKNAIKLLGLENIYGI